MTMSRQRPFIATVKIPTSELDRVLTIAQNTRVGVELPEDPEPGNTSDKPTLVLISSFSERDIKKAKQQLQALKKETK